MHKNRSVLFLIATTLIAALGAVLAFGAVRTVFPSAQDPGPPFYARIEWGHVLHDGATAAIAFYRDPACVPPDFNLPNLFDAPRAFGCPLTVEGFEVWKNGPPPVDAGPIQVETRGLGAVPIWFANWDELSFALSDHVLTIGELRALPSLREGSASFYQETLHPAGIARVHMIGIAAHGTLADGTPFRFGVTGEPGGERVDISFSK